MRVCPILFATLACLSWQGRAAAATGQLICAQAYERAQEERTAGQLSAAIEHLKSCLDSTCPRFIREDCLRWMNQTEIALPTVVFSVRQDGKDLTTVEILCDGNPLVGTLDGKALPVDPGLHNFTFNVPGLAAVGRQLLIREGERNRVIDVDLGTSRESSSPPLPSPSPSPSPASSVKTVPPAPLARTDALAYGLVGVGALGVAGFTVFGLLGNSRQGELERTCAPNCQSDQIDGVRTRYILADTCLGVGLVSLGFATYLLVKDHGRSSPDRNGTTSVSFIPRSTGAGGVLQLSARY
jgi:hypothetical protein